MLEAGMSPDSLVTDDEGESSSALVYAARIRDNEVSVQMARLLLLHKADVSKPQTGEAVDSAISFRDEELVRILLSNGVQLPPRPLEEAVYSRCSKYIVEMLLDAGADIEEIPFLGKARTVLGYAVKEKNRELAQFLLSRGTNPDSLHPVDCHGPGPLARDSIDTWDLFQEYQMTALGMAAFKGNIPMMQILLAARATVNRMDTPDRYLNPLLLAVAEGKNEAARLLLEAGADLHVAERYKVSSGDREISLFKRALEANDLPMCQLLLANEGAAGAQLMKYYYSSQLWEHVKQNDTETVALLLQFGARANDLREGLPNSALGLAITQANWIMISLLQSARATRVGHAVPFIASVQTAQFLEHSNLLSQLLSANGQMILIEAILSQNDPLTNLLNSPPFGDGGMTALQQAAKQGNMELVDLFLKAGANVNQNPASRTGATALPFAAIQDHIGIARRLLDAGASVQAPRAERYGRTALEGAAEHGRLDMVQLLLNEGLLI
ncbi:hypothetical protein ACN38_g8195 [Penicillium nordicum]|uniref:Uncharacterized protein n=1 Tax=Penicillium nordicum TaxID=229535 RepID=A0A0M8P5Q0_9EURO|nr:hypothetical protein ACN38_g8195 [Penicillium nordicum]